ncbi:phosphate ABC transporter permease PstA [Marinibaculum pumilum]|uniref:Phosphate transport system permease protein PstA n=1 Tax=Marinibaculum pumilum TaxID=1766165 RepID=A0ABV7L3L2_9PROT
MSEAALHLPTIAEVAKSEAGQRRLRRRYAAERRFKYYGLAGIGLGVLFLAVMLVNIVSTGWTAFLQTYIQIEVTFTPELVDPSGARTEDALRQGDYYTLARDALKQTFPEVTGRSERRQLNALISVGAEHQLRNMVIADPSLIGTTQQVWVLASDDVDMFWKGYIDRDLPEEQRRVPDVQIAMIDTLESRDAIKQEFNWAFFTNADSREPEMAGIAAGVVGSFLTLLVTLILSLPIGVATAIYLEEFAPKNWITDAIEVNINNLAAVPSIIFGLLGLAVFLNFFGLPRSAPLVGGMVLALMTLPTIIIASRAALKSVPPSIREAALGLGASRQQAMLHHVMPLALPGILTGTIIGMAQALGETAPLLMIGMVAFVAEVPGGITDPSTALPVQVFMWAGSAEAAYQEKTSAAIMVLLIFLIMMNAFAIWLRKKFERRW